MTIETRALPGASISDYQPDRHEFTARVLTYQRADKHGTVWHPDVFTDSLARSMPVICWQHDMTRPVGRAVDATNTADALDLRVSLADVDAVPDARMAHSLLSDRIVNQFSVGFSRRSFDPIPAGQRSAFGTNPATELMRSADLAETSIVTSGSVPDTALLAIRADTFVVETPTVDEILRLRDAGVLTDGEARAMIAARPEYREHIVLTVPAGVIPDELRAAAMPANAPPGFNYEHAAELASTVDEGLDQAQRVLDKFGKAAIAALPAPAKDALSLAMAAGSAIDDLLVVMGIEDDDEDDAPASRADETVEERDDDTDAATPGDTPDAEERAGVDDAEFAAAEAILARHAA